MILAKGPVRSREKRTCEEPDFSDMVILLVSPEISLVDEPVKIQASGLPPEKVITLRAWLKDEKGQIFHSRAFYKTDMEGEGPFPGVIDMFGGVGGLIEFRSSLLASRGFASLALAYFAYDDLPGYLGEMDLKYFEEAAQFLCAHPKVSSDGIGVVAICKGAEIALAMASYLPQVAATVCINGTNAVNGNSLIYGDLALSGIPYKAERFLITDFGSLSLLNFLDDPGKPEHQDSILPLEKARGPILFLVGDKDENYNSLFFAREANARAVKYGKKDVYLRCYPGAGHLLEPPGSPFCSASQSTFFPLPLTWGGELVAHCRAQETSWKELQEFLRKNVRCSRRNKL
ncbi:acyl-coenzyme A amino acid N-acyltransferase 1-like isoform X4 [Hyla sarda]|uniref:acyl-coenzyme A amino acid N-acyltransferase 1-like isoform X4 n=1 Tax=Hyla sarda TaxID=327740 RepID=UPI0024C23DA6|nr:acyl-coenzyme A amino acid N-acyltransferase 1-like isoform X4 [Hyla sarda]